ncbi:MAG: hypothetical protein MUO62_15065 [Anaerolineales bacterium]|nr:hypothetical protein [Anaerolineales bacterium]
MQVKPSISRVRVKNAKPLSKPLGRKVRAGKIDKLWSEKIKRFSELAFRSQFVFMLVGGFTIFLLTFSVMKIHSRYK